MFEHMNRIYKHRIDESVAGGRKWKAGARQTKTVCTDGSTAGGNGRRTMTVGLRDITRRKGSIQMLSH